MLTGGLQLGGIIEGFGGLQGYVGEYRPIWGYVGIIRIYEDMLEYLIYSLEGLKRHICSTLRLMIKQWA